ncbi:MAG: hypothetical protein J2P54_07635 [Bradyrhizobiaceae bacterium]|nr:hypothetical protein [Bradyrhizobiaceae bacterium]
MDQKIVGIVGAVAGLASLDATQGAATAAPNPQGFSDAKSYAELLDPIPNALTRLRAADAAAASAAQTENAGELSGVELAQYYYRHHHHHHHHHRYFRYYYHHHHHHHHHWWWRHHHHHHHHHHYY